jgi:hypothetical protein
MSDERRCDGVWGQSEEMRTHCPRCSQSAFVIRLPWSWGCNYCLIWWVGK